MSHTLGRTILPLHDEKIDTPCFWVSKTNKNFKIICVGPSLYHAEGRAGGE